MKLIKLGNRVYNLDHISACNYHPKDGNTASWINFSMLDYPDGSRELYGNDADKLWNTLVGMALWGE